MSAMSTVRAALLSCAVALVLCLSACAAPKGKTPEVDPALARDEAVRQFQYRVENDIRLNEKLYRVGMPLLRANAPLCRNAVASIGAYIGNIHSVGSEEMQAAYKSCFGADDRLMVLHVFKGSPAEQAGLRDKDVIQSVNGTVIDPGPKAVKKYHGVLNSLDGDKPVDFTILRNGAPTRIEVQPEIVCSPSLFLKHDASVNAYATGNAIVVHTGMIRFVESDEELALIMAHELAHDEMDHIGDDKQNILIGRVADAFLGLLTGYWSNAFARKGAEMFSVEQEFEADYVGMYFAARAGYPIGDMPYLWRKVGAEYPYTITRGSDHPPCADRFVALGATVKEIHAKQDKGEELIPEMKEGEVMPALEE